jgi:hypothetical protein
MAKKKKEKKAKRGSVEQLAAGQDVSPASLRPSFLSRRKPIGSQEELLRQVRILMRFYAIHDPSKTEAEARMIISENCTAGQLSMPRVEFNTRCQEMRRFDAGLIRSP